MGGRMVKIGISCRALLQPCDGVQRYLDTLLPELLEVGAEQDCEFVLFYDAREGVGRFPSATECFGLAPHRVVWDHVTAPGMVRRTRPDVAFFPKGQLPLGIRCPSVVTIHDMGYFVRRPRLYPLLDCVYQRWVLRRSVRLATHVLAVSDATRGEVVETCGVAPERVSVVHEALPPGCFASPPETVWRRLSRELGLEDGGYVLVPGGLHRRKNAMRLVEAFALVADSAGGRLVFTNPASYGHGHVLDSAREQGVGGRVVVVGSLTREELTALYRHAGCCAYVSLYEGFGLPILEAMAADCPVVTSCTTSMPEVAGSAAALVDPCDSEGIASALLRVLTDLPYRRELVAAGRVNLGRFTVVQMAIGTLRVLQRAAGRRGADA